MNPPPGPAPRSPKGVFFIVDGFLLLIAFLIAWVDDPAKPHILVAILGCVILAALVAVIPFILDWVAESREAAQLDQARLAEQTARLTATTEQLNRLGGQIRAVEEAVVKAARDAENLPYRMQEKLAEFNEALAEKEDEQRTALEQELAELRTAHTEQLKAAAAKVAQATGELTTLEKNLRAQVVAAEAAATKLAGAGAEAAGKFDTALQSALGRLDERVAALAKAAPPPAPVSPPPASPAVEAPAPVAPPAPPAAPATRPPVLAAPAESRPPFPTTPVPGEETKPAPTAPEASAEGTLSPAADPAPAGDAPGESAKPRKIRGPRKPKPEETLAAMSGESVATETAPEPAATATDTADTGFDIAPKPEASASSDGATRLLVTAYIGIGNKLFIRGDGPGLSWDQGVPMQFVSIGKWGWFTHESTGPVRVKLYKNDQAAALSGELTLEPGKHTEVTALF